MATKTANSTTSLTATVNNIPDYQKAISDLDQYLAKQGQKAPNENAMRTLHDFLTSDEPFVRTCAYLEFIEALRIFFLRPGVAKLFLNTTRYTPYGLNWELSKLEKFFTALEDKKVEAEVIRFGLATNPEQYNQPEWDEFGNLTKPFREA